MSNSRHTKQERARRALRRLLLGGLVISLCSASVQAGAAERIVIAGGDLTEIVFALGEGQRVVGVDTTATYPAEAVDLPNIGYVRALSPEGVLSLRPESVLVSHFAGPETSLLRLSDAGVRVFRAPAPEGNAHSDVAAKIRFVGEVLDREAAATSLIEIFHAELDSTIREVESLHPTSSWPPRTLFVLSAESGPLVVGGKGTVAEQMIALAGGEPVTGNVQGYRPLAMESVMALAPDVIVMMEEQLASVSHERVLLRSDLAATPAGRHGRLIAMDGMLLLGFGPRTPEAIRELNRSLHRAMAKGMEPN